MTKQAYKQAGVDLDASQEVKRRIRDIAARTHGPEVLAGIGAFGAMYSFAGYAAPVLVASTDPVGTKLKLAVMTGRYEGIGADLVNACVNDVIVCGARPLLFLDYINMSSLRPEVVVTLVEGMTRACQDVGCALIGGETAEMPGVFADDNFDVSGFVLGVVERSEMIDTSKIEAGDALIGVPSNGLHTNGYSLVRHVYGLDSDPGPLEEFRHELGETLGDALLRPHTPYYNRLKACVRHGQGHRPRHRRRPDRERAKNAARRSRVQVQHRRLARPSYLHPNTGGREHIPRRDVPGFQHGPRDGLGLRYGPRD